MKCYSVKNGEDYIADVYRGISSSYWNGNQLETVGSPEEAKHYKVRSQASSWLKKNIQRMQETYDKYKKMYDEQKNSNQGWYSDSYKRNYESAKKILRWLDKAEVVDLDLDNPNFDRKHKIVWDKWRVHRGNAGKSCFKLQVDGHSRYTCKSCGIKLKNIPFYELEEGNSTKICIPCLFIRIDAIKSAFEGMPEDFRTSIVNELILGSM